MERSADPVETEAVTSRNSKRLAMQTWAIEPFEPQFEPLLPHLLGKLLPNGLFDFPSHATLSFARSCAHAELLDVDLTACGNQLVPHRASISLAS